MERSAKRSEREVTEIFSHGAARGLVDRLVEANKRNETIRAISICNEQGLKGD